MSSYDRMAEIKAFDETKAGVKGLVDAGTTRVPRFFHESFTNEPNSAVVIPIIDLKGEHGRVVEEVKRAAETFGFFQVVNHGVPQEVMDEMVQGVRRFNEMDAEVKKGYYSRDRSRKVRFNTNFDLYQAPAANWRDTLSVAMAPESPRPEELPDVCREIIFLYTEHAQRLGKTIFKLLSEALGLHPDFLNEMECAKGLLQAMHYYPPCPEPHVTLGASKHCDPGFITILLQDHIGGLQILHQGHWVDCPSIPGALVINIASLLQLITNDRLVSVEHRVLANKNGPRISVASFFSTQFYSSSRVYGPIKELLSDENPPKYKQVLVADFIKQFHSKGLGRESALNYFKL